jgi:hypothetical protein
LGLILSPCIRSRMGFCVDSAVFSLVIIDHYYSIFEDYYVVLD